jgi:class 3 adenylate cyclase/alpha-beta hydrolase superfamily lysophospholipase
VDDIRYVRADDGTHLAMRVLPSTSPEGDQHDLLMVSGGMIPLEVFEDEPGFVRLVDGLRAIGRVIVFDRRGVGLSDPITDWERPVVDQWADDVATIASAIASSNLVLFDWSGFGVASRTAARCPELAHRLVLYQPIVGSLESWVERITTLRPQGITDLAGNEDLPSRLAPSRASDPSFREWYERAGRVGASPATAARIWASVFTPGTAEQPLEDIRTPTLVLHRPASLYGGEDVPSWNASRVPNATLVALDGVDHWPVLGDVDAVIAATSEFVVGERRVPTPERTLCAVLFTDLVDSTRRAAELGDARWKALLDRHDRVSRAAVDRCRGRVVKSTGDGVLALFPSAGAAVRSACRMRELLADDDLEIRVGIHVGDVDRRGDDVSGLAVNVAARVMSLAGAGEVYVSPSVVAAVAGEAGRFDSVGHFDLKGVPGTWEVFRHLTPS